MYRWLPFVLVLLAIGLLAITFPGIWSDSEAEGSEPRPLPENANDAQGKSIDSVEVPIGALSLTIGSISGNPQKEFRKFEPFVQYIAGLEFENREVEANLKVAESMEEMSEWLRNGEVDIFLDSPFPVAQVCKNSGGRPILRRWKKGVAQYYSVIVVAKDGPITTLEDLRGQLVAFEEPYSTSAYFLPKGTLMQAGFTWKEWPEGQEKPDGGDSIYFRFSGDETNSLLWVLRGMVAAAGVAFKDLDELPEEQAQGLRILHQTPDVPRQVVSVRAGLTPEVESWLRLSLMEMENLEAGRQCLQDFERTTKFDELPGGPEEAFRNIYDLADLLREDLKE
ncbi:MAG: phosphate/phosphite/phosphonate ABC transporter substrate-binding protein [Planctomycetota bacterium]|nr:MAG: phosphate/phosphite/phosphonate ABC transporter substrate-binding protein [Planctomycetota bacterium]